MSLLRASIAVQFGLGAIDWRPRDRNFGDERLRYLQAVESMDVAPGYQSAAAEQRSA